MKRIGKRIAAFGIVRGLALAAAAIFTLSVATTERADAMSLMTPGASPAKAASEGVIQVRGGHGGGGHGGGGHGGFHGGFHGGGFHHGGGGWHGGGFRHFGGFHHFGGHRFAHFHHRRFYGGYYPYYSSYYPHCRIVYTYYGPRRVCGYRHWHRWHRRYYW
jgi:hypothetical protein